MDLQDMTLRDITLKELWGRVDRLLGVVGRSHWSYGWVDSLRAELKRRCGLITEQCAACALMKADDQIEAIIGRTKSKRLIAPPTCPCPVVGERDPSVCIIRQPVLIRCPKCDKWQQRRLGLTEGCANRPCPNCQASKPDAPKGYEFVGEWRVPEFDDAYLAFDGTLVLSRERVDLDRGIDGGKRWILRKKPERPLCLNCGKSLREFEPETTTGLCSRCYATRPPAPAGYEYTGEWRLPVYGEWFVVYDSNIPCYCTNPDQLKVSDQGRRWILKKVPKIKRCMKCDKMLVAVPSLGLCWDCAKNRPDAPPGFEHVGEWRPPKKGDWYLDAFSAYPIAHQYLGNLDWDADSRWILRKVDSKVKLGCACSKCGFVYSYRDRGVPFICDTCLDSRPPAPAGYEFEGRWDYPQYGEPYLDSDGRFVRECKIHNWGRPYRKAWILRKVEEEQKTICPKCKRVQQDTVAGEAIYWLDKPCPNCAPTPLTRADRDLPGKVAGLTRRVEKLEKGNE